MEDKKQAACAVTMTLGRCTSVFGGEEVVDPGSLTPLDTAEIAIPYGDKARSPVQKYRDVIKSWSTMMDGEAVYIILGAENQTDVHYAMPVKSALYDIINEVGWSHDDP